MMSACSEQDIISDSQETVSRMPVLFSAGNTDVALTRATASYMPKDSRFVCSMFFHAGANDTNKSEFGAPVSDVNMTTAWLKINNATGNAVYWNKSYNNENISTDIYGFDENAKCFYWQNRLNHIFLALTDNNKLSTDDETGTLKLFPQDLVLRHGGQHTGRRPVSADDTCQNGSDCGQCHNRQSCRTHDGSGRMESWH